MVPKTDLIGSPESLRERKKEQTRRALEDAAIALFHRNGFDETTIEEIAAAADVSPRTFFRYFATKEAVLFPAETARLEELAATLATRPADEPPLDKIWSAVVAMAEDFGEDEARHLARSAIVFENPALRAKALARQQEWEEMLVQALLVPGADEFHVRLVVAVAMAAVRICHEKWLADPDGLDLPTLALDAIDGLRKGLDLP